MNDRDAVQFRDKQVGDFIWRVVFKRLRCRQYRDFDFRIVDLVTLERGEAGVIGRSGARPQNYILGKGEFVLECADAAAQKTAADQCNEGCPGLL